MFEKLLERGIDLQHYKAISQSHALIWFTPEGIVKGANKNFCDTIGYGLTEIVGNHHRMFVEEAIKTSDDYITFWKALASGVPQHGQFRRISKTGQDVWIEASYDPIIEHGKVVGVLKVAADITGTKIASLHNENLLRALERSVAVIEFSPEGTVVEANSAFCQAMGYERQEIIEKHHRIFCDPVYASSPKYEEFWQRLRAGEFFSDAFKRVGKNGREVWIQATYNPVYSSRGQVYRIVKFATDVSARMKSVGILSGAIGRLANGDLTAQVRDPLDASMESTRQDFNAAVVKLENVVSEITDVTDGIGLTSSALLENAGAIAKRTEQQAAAWNKHQQPWRRSRKP